MAEYSAIFTLTAPGPLVVTFNAASGDTYRNDPDVCTGLDGTSSRVNIDDAPQTDKSIVHPFYRSGRHIVFSGLLEVKSASTEAGVVSARNTLEKSLLTAALAIERADGTLQWTPAGDSSRTLTVRCDIEPTYPGKFQKTYVIGFFAADPAWV